MPDLPPQFVGDVVQNRARRADRRRETVTTKPRQ